MSKAASHKSFPTSRALGEWLADKHASARERRIRLYKSASGKPSVTSADCVIEAIRQDWIDGQKKSLEDSSFLQRLSPRKPRSNWSARKFFATLNRQNLFSIHYRLHSAEKPEMRAKRMAQILSLPEKETKLR